jgi:hypothetical protein
MQVWIFILYDMNIEEHHLQKSSADETDVEDILMV